MRQAGCPSRTFVVLLFRFFLPAWQFLSLALNVIFLSSFPFFFSSFVFAYRFCCSILRALLGDNLGGVVLFSPPCERQVNCCDCWKYIVLIAKCAISAIQIRYLAYLKLLSSFYDFELTTVYLHRSAMPHCGTSHFFGANAQNPHPHHIGLEKRYVPQFCGDLRITWVVK